jgi:hypothetical protein
MSKATLVLCQGTLASIESYPCRKLSVNCSAFQRAIVSRACRICEFGTMVLPRKLFMASPEIMLVLHVVPVLAAKFSWQNGSSLMAKQLQQRRAE